MITNIKVINRFCMKLIVDGLVQPPASPFVLISIYSCPQEELITLDNFRIIQKVGCRSALSQMFEDGSPETEELLYPFMGCHAIEIRDFLDRVQTLDESMQLLMHCDAGIARSGAVANFSAHYLDIDFEDEYIKPNPYISRTLNKLIWETIL